MPSLELFCFTEFPLILYWMQSSVATFTMLIPCHNPIITLFELLFQLLYLSCTHLAEQKQLSCCMLNLFCWLNVSCHEQQYQVNYIVTVQDDCELRSWGQHLAEYYGGRVLLGRHSRLPTPNFHWQFYAVYNGLINDSSWAICCLRRSRSRSISFVYSSR